MDTKLRPLINEQKHLGCTKPSQLIATLFSDHLHPMTLESVRNGALGAFQSGNLAIHAIGKGYAALNGSALKHGIKQSDRLLSNHHFDTWGFFTPWVRFLASGRPELVVALDWTDFDKDDHTTLALYLVTRHGRSSPLLWMTVRKSELADHRNEHEFTLIDHLHSLLPPEVCVTLLADRGFGDHKLYGHLEALGWDYVIRFRGNIHVEHEGVTKPASEWVATNGRKTKLEKAKVTHQKAEVPCVVTVKAAKMKEAWCLASSLSEKKAEEIVALYAKRFTIEETFRDTKDIHFGMGLSATHIKDPKRRDRLMMLAAIAYALLTLLGAASEKSGLDKTLSSSAKKKRTMSLYRQGKFWFEVLDSTRPEWRERLMAAFEEVLQEHAQLREIYGVI
mgnify:CR=1 FL=1